MPVRNNSGGGTFYCNGGKMTRNQNMNGYEHGDDSKRRNRAIREAYRKERKIESYLADDENFPSFRTQLGKLGLQLRDIPGDGNCLFRALGDQLEGHGRNHFRHRNDVVRFMLEHRTDFEPFVEDDLPFDTHVNNLRKLGTHAGNDAIVAFAKMHNVNVVIHQLDGQRLMIQGPLVNVPNVRQLHIAYHNGDHYSSVRRVDDNTESPAHIQLQETVTGAEKFKHMPHHNSYHPTQGVVSARRGLDDIEAEVMVATNCKDIARIQECLMDCDYDVDATIAYLLQQLEMNGETGSETTFAEDGTSLASCQTSTDSGVFGEGQRINGGVLKTNGHKGSVNGKGHKVHFREDSFGGSSGYGSMTSNKGGGARPKLVPAPQYQRMTAKQKKEERKLEKKRRAEERHKMKVLGVDAPVPQHSDVRDVTVVAVNDGKFTKI